MERVRFGLELCFLRNNEMGPSDAAGYSSFLKDAICLG